MRALLLIAALVVALSGAGHAAQETAGSPTQQSARERWEAMTPAEQSLMRKRFETLKGMQEGRQRELRRRHSRWQESERRTVNRLPKGARAQLERLPPEKRREVLRELTEEDVADRGRALLEHLPQEWRERLEAARPEDRRRVMEEFRKQYRGRGERGVLDRAQRDLGLEPEERDAIEALPEAEREPRLFELHASSIRTRIQREGLPPFIDQDEWPALEALEPRLFLEEFHARHRQSGEQVHGRDAAERRERPGGPGAGSLNGQLRTLARPDPSWRVELSKLTPDERRVAIEARVRARVDAFLDEHPAAATPQQRAALEAAQGREYFELLRETVGGSGRGGPGARGPAGKQDAGGRRRPPGLRGPTGGRGGERRSEPGARGSRDPASQPPRSPRR